MAFLSASARTAAAPGSGPARETVAGAWLLAGAALVAPITLAATMAAHAGWGPFAVLAGAALAAWSLADARVTVVVAMLMGTFVDYNAGHLTVELTIVTAWLGWSALLFVWRSGWAGWTLPPREMLAPLAVWLAVCAFGTVSGLVRGNPLRAMGIELVGAMWPFVGLVVMQAFRRRSLGYALVALVVIGCLHTVFGLSMLQVYHRRLGGIYFTTVTGIAAVGLWIAAVLAPRRRTRVLCLAAMIPMLMHLFFSFTRGYWLGFIAGFVTASALAWRDLGRFAPAVRIRRLVVVPALLVVAACTLGVAFLYFGGPNLLEAAGGRFSSSFSTQATTETLSNIVRLDEYDKAIGAALKSPIVGQGIGYSFITRDFLTRVLRDQWFVHNYYLLLWLKMGVLGLAAFAVLTVSFMRAALRVASQDEDWRVRAWSLGAVAMTVQLLVILTTNYSLADLNTASTVAFVWGVFWSVHPGVRAA